uniref:G_PROTEIN_RECEP_F1_2 domain-containing protein n=1 Tax=Parastrongyloides trichosuri TaxID=131310 RepID=A0A0N4ZRU9_PARTI
MDKNIKNDIHFIINEDKNYKGSKFNITSSHIEIAEYNKNKDYSSSQELENEFFTIAGPQILASLFNSTVSMLSLLAMAIIQIFGNKQNWLPKSAPLRITISLWSVILVIIISNFALIQITKSIALLFAFHIALLSIFLLINLLLHPINLIFSLRERSENQVSRAITEALWLLLHSLSFVLLVTMLIWESSQKVINVENLRLLSLQQAAYSVHCIANPFISLLRDPKLVQSIGELIYTKEHLSPREYSTILTSAQHRDSNESRYNQWVISESMPFRFERPPPPYITPNNSVDILCESIYESNLEII